jgi:flavin-binding protein dodecin
VETAAKNLKDLRIGEVTKMDVMIKKGKIVTCRTRPAVSF